MKNIITAFAFSFFTASAIAQCDTLLDGLWNLKDACATTITPYEYSVQIVSNGDSAKVILVGLADGAFKSGATFSYNCTNDNIYIPLQDPDNDGGYVVGNGMYVWQKDKIVFNYGYRNVAGISDSCRAELTRSPQSARTAPALAASARVAPSPFAGSARLITEGMKGAIKVDIYNMLGNKVYSPVAEGKEAVLNARSLGSGIYFYSVKDQSGRELNGRFVVE